MPQSCQPWQCSAEESGWRSCDQLPGPKSIRSLSHVQTPSPAVELREVLPGGCFRDLEPVRGQRNRPRSDVRAQDLELAPGRSLASGRHDADCLRVAASHSALPWMGTRTMVLCLRLPPGGRAKITTTCSSSAHANPCRLASSVSSTSTNSLSLTTILS